MHLLSVLRPGNRQRRWIAAVGVATAVVAIGACGGGSGDAGGSTLTVAVAADPRSLVPNSSTAQQEINISEQITEKLIEFNQDASGFEPRLATEWKQINPTTLQLTLRKGVTFTNGEPFNAQSAAKSIEIMRKAPAYASFTSMISGAKAVGDDTLQVTTEKPSGLVLNALALGSFQYPVDYWAKVGEDGFGSKPIGTGPYELSNWTKGTSITLTANPDYWGGKPSIGTLVFNVVPDKSAQVAAAQSGQADFIYDVPVGSIDTLKAEKDSKLVTRPSNRVYLISFSELTDTPLKKADVRQALQYAIDVPALIKDQLGGYGTPLQGQILPPNYVGFDKSVTAIKYDPAKAKELLAKAGYPNGFTVTFKYPSGRYPQDREIGQAIADQLSRVGVKTNQQALESGTFLTQLTSLKLNDMFFAGYLTAPDAHVMYDQFVTGAPYTYYENTKVDELVKKEATTVDQKERQQIFAQITKIFQQDPPFVPLFQGTDTYVVSNKVSGFTPRASQFVDYQALKITG